MTWIMGIDPGFSGGLAVLRPDGSVVAVEPFPSDEVGSARLIRSMADRAREQEATLVAFLESVNAHKGWQAAGAFTFGRSVGAIRATLALEGIPTVEAAPSRWMRALGCLTSGQKSVTLRKAQQRFPKAAVTHRTADALLLAEYGRLTWPGAGAASQKEMTP